MTSKVQVSHRRGSIKREEGSKMFRAPDVRQVTVLTKAEWQRIQNEVNQIDRDKESMREAEQQRKALHLRSKQMVKEWPDTITNQRKKKLEAKKIREQIMEEKRKQLDIEEDDYKDQQRRDIVVKAKTQLFNQTTRVKGLHSALLMAEVLKEREAQIELKKRSASKDVEKEFMNSGESRKDEVLREAEEKAVQRKIKQLAFAEELEKQVKEFQLAKERQEKENKKDGEEKRRLHELYLLEQRMDEERQEEEKRNLKQSQLEYITKRDLRRAAEFKKRAAEEEKRKVYVFEKEIELDLKKEKETELFRETQRRKERFIQHMMGQQQGQEHDVIEDQRIARAIAEMEARREQQLKKEEENRAEVLESIAVHRAFQVRQKEQRDKDEKQNCRDILMAKKKAEMIFLDEETVKAQRTRDELRKIQDCNSTQLAEKVARKQQLRREKDEFEAKTREILAEEEKQFLIYSHKVINTAAEAQRDILTLCKAASDGIGGGLGPIVGGVKPSYMVQEHSGVPLPIVSGATLDIYETVDIDEAKKRMGFIW